MHYPTRFLYYMMFVSLNDRKILRNQNPTKTGVSSGALEGWVAPVTLVPRLSWSLYCLSWSLNCLSWSLYCLSWALYCLSWSLYCLSWSLYFLSTCYSTTDKQYNDQDRQYNDQDRQYNDQDRQYNDQDRQYNDQDRQYKSVLVIVLSVLVIVLSVLVIVLFVRRRITCSHFPFGICKFFLYQFYMNCIDRWNIEFNHRGLHTLSNNDFCICEIYLISCEI
jgi:hypothetical protein